MSRITNNIPAVISQRELSNSHQALSVALQRLSSGLQINRGADDPAGLIVSERLRSEISAVGQAIDNSERAINVIATAEGAINEVNSLLTDIQALVVEAANRGAMSDDEIEANQLQIDEAIEAISRIANTTTFAGRKLLDGSLDYTTSGIDYGQLASVEVWAAQFGRADYVPVDIAVTSAALQAEARIVGPGIGGSSISIDLQGPKGIMVLSFPASTSTNAIVDAINNTQDSTGVTAEFINGDPAQGARLLSNGYGSNEFVRVQTLQGSAKLPLVDRNGVAIQDGSKTKGHDAVATINGAPTVADGLRISLRNFQAKIDITLEASMGVGSTSFAITDGGSLFQLGPRVNTNQQLNIGVPAMQANKLGNRSLGFLSQLGSGQDLALKSGEFDRASDIVDHVITEVARLRGRLGAFERNNLRPNINQLQITSENLTSSESIIRDTDFAEETTELTRAQILVQAGTSVLAIANAQQQNVLQLLGG